DSRGACQGESRLRPRHREWVFHRQDPVSRKGIGSSIIPTTYSFKAPARLLCTERIQARTAKLSSFAEDAQCRPLSVRRAHSDRLHTTSAQPAKTSTAPTRPVVFRCSFRKKSAVKRMMKTG